MAAGGAVAYLQSRFSSKKPDSLGHYNETRDNTENSNKVLKKNNNVKRTRQKKGGLKSLQVLVAILLSKMGKVGSRDLLALVGTVVSLSICVFPTWFNTVFDSQVSVIFY